MIPLSPVALAVCLLLASCQHPPPATTGPDVLITVTYVGDGDTVTVVDGAGERVRVRLLGIDAPEVAHAGKSGECGATAATAALKRLVLDQRVTLVRRAPTRDQSLVVTEYPPPPFIRTSIVGYFIPRHP